MKYCDKYWTTIATIRDPINLAEERWKPAWHSLGGRDYLRVLHSDHVFF